MLTKRRLLKKMGIPSWRARMALPVNKPVSKPKATPQDPVLCYCYHLKKSGETVAMLLAEYGSGDLAESNLVSAIAAALPGDAEGKCQQISAANYQAFEQPAFVLGANLARQLAEQQNYSQHTPAEILADSALKREVWQQLKAFSRP